MSYRETTVAYGEPRLELQPGWTITDDKAAGVTLQATFKGDKQTYLDDPASITTTVSEFPILNVVDHYNLQLDTWTSKWGATQLTIDVTYIGANFVFDEQSTEEEYELSVGVGEIPIELHPNFDRKMARYGIFRDINTNNVVPNGTSRSYFDRFMIFDEDGAKTPLAGVSSYLTPNAIRWRVKRTQLSRPSVTGAGRITNPPGSPPTPGSGWSWLNLGTNYSQVGNLYQVTEEYQLGRWKSEIYR